MRREEVCYVFFKLEAVFVRALNIFFSEFVIEDKKFLVVVVVVVERCLWLVSLVRILLDRVYGLFGL